MENKNTTLLIIKPDAIKKKIIGKIISILENNNFKIIKIKTIKMNKKTAQLFYHEHKDKCFFNELISFITSEPVMALILKGTNVIKKTRNLIGDTNFKKAKKDTIRNLFSKSLTENTVHASDSYESFKREKTLIFPEINE